MLAGILIAIVVVAGLGFALPWVTAQRSNDVELEGDPSERFSNSVRILRRDVVEYKDEDASAVSTPLTRRAELHELRMIARQAARRRLVVVGTLAGSAVVLSGLALASVVDWWTVAVPAGLLLVFLVIARFSVVAMHRSLDARAAATANGFGDEEHTETIDLSEYEGTASVEISVDLSMPTSTGVLWDPIPVTPATYVSQPLLPRTVRTIDLSAPVAATLLTVPTADHPSDQHVEEQTEASLGHLAEFRPRAIGE